MHRLPVWLHRRRSFPLTRTEVPGNKRALEIASGTLYSRRCCAPLLSRILAIHARIPRAGRGADRLRQPQRGLAAFVVALQSAASPTMRRQGHHRDGAQSRAHADYNSNFTITGFGHDPVPRFCAFQRHTAPTVESIASRNRNRISPASSRTLAPVPPAPTAGRLTYRHWRRARTSRDRPGCRP